MTQRDPPPEELALARECADASVYPEGGPFWTAAFEAALSAIQQTTELAAIMCDTGYSVEPGESCATALRRNNHLGDV